MLPVEERVNKKSVVLRNKGILLEHDVENKGADKSPLLNTENHLLLFKRINAIFQKQTFRKSVEFCSQGSRFLFLKKRNVD